MGLARCTSPLRRRSGLSPSPAYFRLPLLLVGPLSRGSKSQHFLITKKASIKEAFFVIGAGNGIRTHDINLGNQIYVAMLLILRRFFSLNLCFATTETSSTTPSLFIIYYALYPIFLIYQYYFRSISPTVLTTFLWCC